MNSSHITSPLDKLMCRVTKVAGTSVKKKIEMSYDITQLTQWVHEVPMTTSGGIREREVKPSSYILSNATLHVRYGKGKQEAGQRGIFPSGGYHCMPDDRFMCIQAEYWYLQPPGVTRRLICGKGLVLGASNQRIRINSKSALQV